MSSRITLVAIEENQDGSLVIQNANGVKFDAKSGQQAWLVLKQILGDDSIPSMEEPTAVQADVEEAVTEFVKSNLPPGMDKLAGPFVRSGLGFLQKIPRKHR